MNMTEDWWYLGSMRARCTIPNLNLPHRDCINCWRTIRASWNNASSIWRHCTLLYGVHMIWFPPRFFAQGHRSWLRAVRWRSLLILGLVLHPKEKYYVCWYCAKCLWSNNQDGHHRIETNTRGEPEVSNSSSSLLVFLHTIVTLNPSVLQQQL